MKKVLIIEDNSVQIKVFEKIVNQLDIECYLATTGNEGLEKLREYNSEIGLVLLDLALPDISGLDILQKVKAENIKTPIAILSASEDSKIALEAGKLGAVDFFIKGSSNKDLLRLFEFISEIIV